MQKSERRPLKIRRKSDLRGWWLLLALVAVLAAMIWTSSMNGQGPFALAIMGGLSGFGALLGAYVTARRPAFLFNEKGIYSSNLGRSLAWENIQGIRTENERVLIDVLEGSCAWCMPINLNTLRLNPKSRQKLELWFATTRQSEEPESNSDSSCETFSEYAVKQRWGGA